MSSPELPARFRAARTAPGLAVLEGFHAIKHAIRFGADIIDVAARNPDELQELANRLAPDVAASLRTLAVAVPAGVFDQLSPTPPDTGVIAIARRRVTAVGAIVSGPRIAPVVLLESPSHSGNIGAVIRVAAGAGAAAVVTTGSNDPWNPGAIRGSAGLHYALPVIRVDTFDPAGREMIAIDPEGVDLARGGIPAGAVLVFGSERSGLSDVLLSRATRRVRIPMRDGVSSLNLATAVAIVLYSWRLDQ